MKTILGFFGAGPARLQALLIGAMAMAVTCLALTAWALWERSGKLSCEVERVTLAAQVAVLADKLNTQNTAVDALGSLGNQIRGDVKTGLAKIGAAEAARAAKFAELADLIKKPPPVRADGKPADCADAWREIERRSAQ